MYLNYLISFTAGILSVLSPCILPLIPIILGHSLIRKDIRETISFVGGFYLIFAIIILLTVFFTLAINQFLYYFRIASSILIITLGIILISTPGIKKSYKFPVKNRRVMGSFIIGFITSLAWSTCFGPYILVIATYSVSTGDVFYSIVNMLLFTLGFSLIIFLMALILTRLNLEKLLKYSRDIRIYSGILITIGGFYMFLGQLGLI